MTRQLFISLTIATVFYGCASQTTDKGQSIPANNSSTEILFNKLDMPKHWTEIKKQDSEWVYFIPCQNIRNVQTVEISNIDNIPRITCDFGTETQWFAIKNIHHQADSLIFTTFLPYEDSSSTVLMSMKYLDKEKDITQWTTDGVVCTYIPTADTIKYKRITEPCE